MVIHPCRDTALLVRGWNPFLSDLPRNFMQNAIKREIKRIADRQLARAAGIKSADAEYRDKFYRRTGVKALVSKVPTTPVVSRHFDAIYCKRNANFLAKTIWHKVTTCTYAPSPAIEFFIDKPGGGKRRLMAFSIPDTALGNVLMRRVRGRNIKKFSPHSFAYHPDKNVFDAVLDLRSFIVTTPKIYSIQIDFKDFFDSIPKGYLEGLLGDAKVISLTASERHVIGEFLAHRYAQREQYKIGAFSRRHRGTPQGSSISLILANLANHALDTNLEKLPGKFVRFADDVTALASNYDDAVRIEHAFFEHCHQTGIVLNRDKSPGINILSSKTSEIRTVPHIDYLGYRFTQDGLTMSEKAIRRIKSKLSRLCSIYLIQYVRDVGFNPTRVSVGGKYDWDLLGFVSEVRNYLYGGLLESEVRSMIRSGKKLRRMTGFDEFLLPA